MVGASEARTAGVARDAGVGGGVGATVAVGGVSEAVMAVTPACAVSAAAVFVGPMTGDCATMTGMALAPVAKRTATVPIIRTTIRGSPALLMKGSRLGGVQHPLPQQVKVRSPVHRALRRF